METREGQAQQVINNPPLIYMNQMLRGVITSGSGRGAAIAGRDLAGKTGTTNEYRSAWFVGFSSDIVVGVFIGFDDNRPLGSGETGATGPVPVFNDFMQVALKKLGEPVDAPSVVVGDSVFDVEAAKNAGMPAIVVRSGGFGDDELRDAGAVAIYDTPADLTAALDDTDLA